MSQDITEQLQQEIEALKARIEKLEVAQVNREVAPRENVELPVPKFELLIIVNPNPTILTIYANTEKAAAWVESQMPTFGTAVLGMNKNSEWNLYLSDQYVQMDVAQYLAYKGDLVGGIKYHLLAGEIKDQTGLFFGAAITEENYPPRSAEQVTGR